MTVSTLKRTLLLTILALTCVASVSNAATTTIKGKLLNGSGYRVALIDGLGRVSLKSVGSSGNFSMRTTSLRNATLALLDPSGRAFGPVVLTGSRVRQKAYLGFSGVVDEGKSVIDLGEINIKSGFAIPKRKLSSKFVRLNGSLVSNTDSRGNPEGAATGGLAITSAARLRARTAAAESGESLASVGQDTDADGIIDALDPDVDGDGVVNIADPDFAGNDDATFSSLVVDYAQTLNANIGSVEQADIDAVISGDHVFNIGFWSSLPSESEITGGHVICSSANAYCNRTTGTAIYRGLTESDPALRDQVWRTMNADGSGYPNLELLNVRGFQAVAAAIEPAAGTSAVRPGDTYLVNFTGAGGRVIENKLLVLSPYMVTVPALQSFTVDATTTTIDYSDILNQPGANNSNPIITNASGQITFTFWRPQRLLYRTETPASPTDRYRDMGRLKYGVLFEGGAQQFTCAGLYSGISSDLTEVSGGGLGTGGSPFPDQGAELFPLRDTSDDATPSPSRNLSVTVDLRTCLTRASQPVGTYRVRLIARGEDLSGGANSSSQMFNVTVQ